MKGDFTRLTFDAKKHYSSVRMQQGRVQLDADWNEQVDIALHRERLITGDIVGKCGAPIRNPGFALIFEENGLDGKATTDKEQAQLKDILKDKRNFIIGHGSYYANGILCENEELVPYSNQPDYLPSLDEIKDGFYITYLKVWERHITLVEDPDIREIALGGADTATRTKAVWQVKLKGPFDPSENWDDVWRTAIPKRIASIAVRIKKGGMQKEPCSFNPDASCGNLGNNLYRIEIHDEGKMGEATFKWSRDNGSLAWPISKIDGNVITIESRGINLSTVFKPDQWVELTNDIQELNEQPGIFSQVISADGFHLVLDPKIIESISDDSFSLKWKPKARCWDSQVMSTSTYETSINIEKIAKNSVIIQNPGQELLGSFAPGRFVELTDNLHEQRGKNRKIAKVESQKINETTVELMLKSEELDNAKNRPLEEDLLLQNEPRILPYDPEKWIELEEGLEVRFAKGDNHYRNGDYWLIPARSAGGYIDWPADEKGIPKFQQRFGTKHHYCRLAILQYSPAGWKIVQDYRRQFAPLTELEIRGEPLPREEPNHRIRDALNAVLKGNMPSDLEFLDLMEDKTYFHAFGDSTGNIWLFGKNEDQTELWATMYRDGVWKNFGKDRPLVNRINSKCVPVIFEDSKSDLWIFWCSDKNIYYKKYISGDWSPEEPLTEGNVQKSNLEAFEDSRGDIWLFWQQGEDFWCMRSSSGQWIKQDQPLIKGPMDEVPDIIEDSLKNIWIFWRQNDNIWPMRFSGEAWHKQEMISKGDAKKEDLKIIDGPNGDVWAFWLQKNSSQEMHIYCATYIAGKWETNTQIRSGGIEKQLLNIFRDSHDTIWIFWKQENDIFYRNYSYGSDFGDETNLTNNSKESTKDKKKLEGAAERRQYLEAVEDSRGTIWLFWWESENIFFRKKVSDGWREKEVLAEAPEKPKVYAINRKDGDLWILFERLDSDNFWCKKCIDGKWLSETRMTNEISKKIYYCTFEDSNRNQWLFWKPEGVNYLSCKRFFDEV